MKGFADHINANAEKWDRRATSYDQRRVDYFRFIQRKLLSFIGLQKPTTLLDLGCGTGWAVRTAAEMLEGDGRFVGIDISPEMIKRAKAKALGMNAVEFHRASADKLPFEDSSFDVVICTNSFHHYPDPVKALAEARRVLRKQGHIYILDLTRDTFWARWLNRRVTKKEKEHVKFYSTAEYREMFRTAGLTYIQSESSMYVMKIHIAQNQV
jgi:ubiquinone/menaquinone biosynthesis C-methylase UbiE